MKRFMLGFLLMLGSTGTVSAQQITGIVLSPPGGASDFCYYAGIAYSETALLTIDVPNRRDSPVATQKALLLCVRSEGSETLVWKRVESE